MKGSSVAAAVTEATAAAQIQSLMQELPCTLGVAIKKKKRKKKWILVTRFLDGTIPEKGGPLSILGDVEIHSGSRPRSTQHPSESRHVPFMHLSHTDLSTCDRLGAEVSTGRVRQEITDTYNHDWEQL